MITNYSHKLLKEKAGINLFVKKAKFNPFTFELTLNDIVLNDLDSKPAIGIKKIYIDYTFLGLFHKIILIHNIDIQSPKLYVKIQKNSKVNLENLILPKNNATAKKGKSANSSFVFTLDKLNIQNGAISFKDERENKNFKLDFGPYNFDAHDISTKTNNINSYTFKTSIQNQAKLKFAGGMSIEPLKLYGELTIDKLKLPYLYSYILPDMKASLESGFLHTDIPFQIDFKNGFNIKINNAKTKLTQINIEEKKTKESLVKLSTLSIDGFNLAYPKQFASISSIKLSGVNINAKLKKGGTTNLTDAFIPETEGKKKSNPKTNNPWKYLLKNLDITKSNIAFTDYSQPKEIITKLKKITLHVENISSDTSLPISYNLATSLNKNAKISSKGEVHQAPISLTSNLKLTNLSSNDFVDYLSPYVNFKIKNTDIDMDAKITAKLDKKLYINIIANSDIKNLSIETLKKQKLLEWKDLRITGIRYTNQPNSTEIKSIKFMQPYIKIAIAKNGSANFANLIKKKQKSKKETEQNKSKKSHLKLKIGPMKLVNGATDYSDFSLPFPFKTHIHDLNGNVSTLNFNSTVPSIMKLEGKIDRYGYAQISGVLLPFKIKKSANIDVLFKNINLSSLTPYSGKFLGYKIKNGKLSMDLNYKISNSKLIGSNKINIDTLTLGEQVKSPDAVNLPLSLAIALLKDSNGQIDIDLPVAGDMNNPDFSYGSVVWRAIGNMITGIVTAPFRFLGSILGIKGDDLKAIDFEKGSYKIISTELEKLNNLKKILDKRPSIKIKISGGYDKIYDTKELQKLKFIATIKSKLSKAKKKKSKAKVDAYGIVLKKLYTKQFSLEQYNKLKKVYTTITKNKKKVEKSTLNRTEFNKKMQNELIQNIKVEEKELISLANHRAKNIQDTLVKKYKIDATRIKITKPIQQKAKRDRWIETKLEIVI